jgi:hypothetical protein
MLTNVEARGVLLVKLIQLLKLKTNAQQATATLIVKLLNDDAVPKELISFEKLLGFFFDQCDANQVYPSDKEKYILQSQPTVLLVRNGLLAYQLKESQVFLNATLALSLETEQLPIDFFNEYTLTQRGRQGQGVTLFKN